MISIRFRHALSLALVCIASLSAAPAGQRAAVVSSMKNVRAVGESRGYFLVPSTATAGQIIPGDEGPTQSFEIIRPSGSRVTIGRLFTSCSCVRLESPKTTFERGEPAILTLRNVRATPPSGQTYALYVQVTSPIRATLRVDTFVKSDRFIVSEPVAVVEAPVLVEPEIVVPLAEPADDEDPGTEQLPPDDADANGVEALPAAPVDDETPDDESTDARAEEDMQDDTDTITTTPTAADGSEDAAQDEDTATSPPADSLDDAGEDLPPASGEEEVSENPLEDQAEEASPPEESTIPSLDEATPPGGDGAEENEESENEGES